MYLRSLLAAAALLSALPSTLACAGHAQARAASPETTGAPVPAPPQYPQVMPGPNNASDVATTGYFINHVAFNVRNRTASIDFYTRVLGMRVIFVYQATAKLSITYMGHQQGGRNGSGYQSVSELNRDKNNAAGLLELIFYDDADSLKGLAPSTAKANTFSHIGIIVPDLEATQRRLDSFGVKVWKRFGETPTLEEILGGPVAVAYGLGGVPAMHPEEEQAIYDALIRLVPGVSDFIYASDPDGNYIEIESLYSPQLPI